MTQELRPLPGEQLSSVPPGIHDDGAAPRVEASPQARAWGRLRAADPRRSRRPLSLRTRLVGVLLILLLAGFAVIGGVTHASMSARLNGEINTNLTDAWERANKQSRSGVDYTNTLGQPPGTIVVMYADGNAATNPRYQDESTGEQLIVSQADQNSLKAVMAKLPTSASSTMDVNLAMGRYRFLVYPRELQLKSSTGEVTPVTGVVGIGLPTGDMYRTLGALDLSMVLVSLGGLLLIGTLGSVLISRSLRPLARVSAVASAVAEQPLERGEVDVDLRVSAEDATPGTEVGNVGLALNNLLDNVDAALEVRAHSEARMRRFAADASHELRTPLAAIQGYSELLGATEALSEDGDRSLERVREQTRRMTELVENLLLLARLDESKPAASEPVDLTALAADLSRDFAVAAPDHVWAFEPSGPQPVTVKGDESQLARVLSNLMSNARKHTSEGTHVTVRLGTSPDGSRAVVQVHDTGEGIDAEFVDKVFDRFARADAARSGSTPTTGLGLSIVKAIVEAHGGTIEVTSTPGDTSFEVRLPLLPSSALG